MKCYFLLLLILAFSCHSLRVKFALTKTVNPFLAGGAGLASSIVSDPSMLGTLPSQNVSSYLAGGAGLASSIIAPSPSSSPLMSNFSQSSFDFKPRSDTNSVTSETKSSGSSSATSRPENASDTQSTLSSKVERIEVPDCFMRNICKEFFTQDQIEKEEAEKLQKETMYLSPMNAVTEDVKLKQVPNYFDEDFKIKPVIDYNSPLYNKDKAKVYSFSLGKNFYAIKFAALPNSHDIDNQLGQNEVQVPRELQIWSTLSNWKDRPDCDKMFTILRDYKLRKYEEKWWATSITDLYDGSLMDYIKNDKKYKLLKANIFRVFKDCLKGLNYIHSNGIVHRDIKPENVFIKETIKNGRIVVRAYIADFGAALYKTRGDEKYILNKSEEAGTSQYMSPEISPHIMFTDDIWSLGMTFYWCLFRGMPPFFQGIEKQIKQILGLEVFNEREQITKMDLKLRKLVALVRNNMLTAQINRKNGRKLVSLIREIDYEEEEGKQKAIPRFIKPNLDSLNSNQKEIYDYIFQYYESMDLIDFKEPNKLHSWIDYLPDCMLPETKKESKNTKKVEDQATKEPTLPQTQATTEKTETKFIDYLKIFATNKTK